MITLPKRINVFRAFMVINEDGKTVEGISYHKPSISITVHELLSNVSRNKSYEFFYLVDPNDIGFLFSITEQGEKPCSTRSFKTDPLQNGVLVYKNQKGKLKFLKKF